MTDGPYKFIFLPGDDENEGNPRVITLPKVDDAAAIQEMQRLIKSHTWTHQRLMLDESAPGGHLMLVTNDDHDVDEEYPPNKYAALLLVRLNHWPIGRSIVFGNVLLVWASEYGESASIPPDVIGTVEQCLGLVLDGQ